MTAKSSRTRGAKEPAAKILVCDDEERREEEWAKRIKKVVGSQYEVLWARPKDLLEWLTILNQRRQASRSNTREATNPSTEFDKASIVFIDYDLLRLATSDNSARFDGESLAYLVRCYSTCGIIVALNRYGSATKTFDLTLRGHPESYADVGIGSEHVAEPGLWGVGKKKGFCPWAWPILPDAVHSYEQCLRELDADNAFDSPILTFLGFDSAMVDSMPRTVLEFLSRRRSPKEVTFKQFVTESGNGLRGKDRTTEEQMRRIAVARIRKWLTRMLLAGQDIIVDAPHLVSRFSTLAEKMKVERVDAVEWKRISADKFGPAFEKHAFRKPHWLSRTAWNWAAIRGDEEIEEVARPWQFKPVSEVFCEDISRFVSRRCSREFVSDVGSAFVRRFVVNPDDDKLGPLVQGVQYEPIVRFWMAS